MQTKKTYQLFSKKDIPKFREKIQNALKEVNKNLGASGNKIQNMDKDERLTSLINETGENLGYTGRGVELQEALDRIEDETYGICEKCYNPIEFERLDTLLTTKRCRECKE